MKPVARLVRRDGVARVGCATSRRYARSKWPILLAPLALLWAVSAKAQAPRSQAPEATFGETLDVRVVNVEVVVLDKDGRRVKGLLVDDFRLFVDGAEVPIDHFAEVTAGRTEPSQGDAPPPSAGDGGAVVTNYLIFVDDDHTIQAFRRPVMDGIAQALDDLAPRDRVAVVAKSWGRLELLSGYTTDRAKSRVALSELARGKRFGGALTKGWLNALFLPGGGGSSPPQGDETPLGQGLQQPISAANPIDGTFTSGPAALRGGNSPLPSDLPLADYMAASGNVLERMIPRTFEQEARAVWLERLLGLSASSVSSAMRALDPSSGRKVLLLVAGNWPTGDFRPSGESLALRTDRELVMEIVNTANLLGYTVYPVDQATTNPSTPLWQNLRMIARDTGGRTFMAGANLTALDRLREDTADYYWLGFTPDYRHDDAAHDIRVEVRPPGLKLRARRGFVDLSPETRRRMALRRSLLFRSASDSAATFEGRAGRPERIDGRLMAVPLLLELPVGAFVAMPGPDGYVQRLQVRIGAIDRMGRLVSHPAVPLTLRPPAAPPSDATFPFRATLTLRRLPHSVVVRVEDLWSEESSEARFEISPNQG